MDYKIEEINPGQQIFELLKTIIPFDDSNKAEDVDYFFKEDGKFNEINYLSNLYYILRRLIKTAVYLRKRGELISYYGNEDLVRDLRMYLTEQTRFESDDIEKLIILLGLCLNYNNSTPSSTRIQRMISKAIEDQIPCYICGSLYIDYENYQGTTQDTGADKRGKLKVPEVEHLWPRSMGGSNQEFNLKVACKKCNGAKESYIDSADFHYEHICYDFTEIGDEGNPELKYHQKIALWAKDRFSCVVCGQSAEEVGTLNFRRLDENDSWHYLNISAFCNQHI